MRQIAVVFILGTLLLAGCIGGAKDKPLDKQQTNVSAINGTAPDGRGNLVAFEETNKTETTGIGAASHTHDYWLGRARVTLFDITKPMEPTTDNNNQAYRDFHVPLPNTVFEGTSQIEFTISEAKRHVCFTGDSLGSPDDHFCTDSPAAGAGPHVDAGAQPDPTGGPSGLKLRYKHASTTTWLDAGELAWGTPSIIKITDPKQTDMPHSTASGWVFEVLSPNAADTSLIFHAKAEIVRGEGAIVPWPAHPLFYADSHIREVCKDCPAVEGETGFGGLPPPKEAGPYSPKRLISYGTRALYVWANITSVDAPNPATAPSIWWLSFTNSTGDFNATNPFDATNHSADKKSHMWALSVDDAGMDSPYSDGSKWTFDLRGALTPPAGPTCYDGCAAYTVKYTLTILASDVPNPEADPGHLR